MNHRSNNLRKTYRQSFQNKNSTQTNFCERSRYHVRVLPLGTIALLLYQLDKLRNESPLPLCRKQTRINESKNSKGIGGFDECDANEENSLQPLTTCKRLSVYLVISGMMTK